jgi:hypothetical protein
MPKIEPTKSIKELLNDPELESKPDIPTSFHAPEKMTMKNLLMMQAFNAIFSSIFAKQAGASSMVRKWEFSKSEIHDAIRLTLLVGECYDNVTKPMD